VKQQRRQPFDPRVERLLAIRLPEESGIAQRAETTRSMLREMVFSLSGSLLITARKAGNSLPSSPSTGK
jgi:hypothetical protein